MKSKIPRKKKGKGDLSQNKIVNVTISRGKFPGSQTSRAGVAGRRRYPTDTTLQLYLTQER